MLFPITDEEWPAIGGGPCVVTIQFHLREEKTKYMEKEDNNNEMFKLVHIWPPCVSHSFSPVL